MGGLRGFLIVSIISQAALLVPQLGKAMPSSSGEPKIFVGLWENVADSFTGNNLFFHAGALASTALMVNSGIDAHVHDTFKHSKHLTAIPGAIAGSGLAAATAGIWLYSDGKSKGDYESIGAAFAIAQSTLITLTYVSALKATTGRSHPTNSNHEDSLTQSKSTEPFNGVMSWGWPSGHVSHTAAVTSALAYYYPDKKWLPWFGAGTTAYMIYSVSAHYSGQMHWASDGVAGAFMGFAIGSTVGRNMRQQIAGVRRSPSSSQLVPLIGKEFVGLFARQDF